MHLPISGDNGFFLELYARYQRDRASVPIDWVIYFESLLDDDEGAARSHEATRFAPQLMLDAYRQYGYFEATLDPLGLNKPTTVPLLQRLRREMPATADKPADIELGGTRFRGTLSEFSSAVHSIYVRHVGIEAAHVPDETQRDWLHAAFEAAFMVPPEPDLQLRALESVILADEFESFARTKFVGKKRFGIEGGESTIVFLRELLRSATASIDEVVMGGMHRGRLATLATVFGKPAAILFGEFTGEDLTDGTSSFTGDVPYHLGYTGQLNGGAGTMRLRLLPHPSHLATVAPVTLGRARAAIDSGYSTLCVMLHTDAAFAGQGVFSEVMQLGGLRGYSVGGTVHVVVNNQIGFTTSPLEGRSAHYCTDIGKSVGVPIFHVNGDDPVAAARVARIAFEWRQRFGKDVLIDIVCYRRYGHNELDEPRFTQPSVCAAIDTHPLLRDALVQSLSEAVPDVTARATEISRKYHDSLQASYEARASVRSNVPVEQGEGWSDIESIGESELGDGRVETGLSASELRHIGHVASSLPADLDVNWKVQKFYEARRSSIEAGEGINFATAEALAFATLLADGIPVRLSGQDSVRGTFTQRHLAVYAQDGSRNLMPVSCAARGAAFEAINSPLSEYAVLGFEYGFSLANPRQLVMWEAQFGDFLNGAQVMVDQFIVSAEAKWNMKSGIVVLLPHGLEGQGPDHSSARIERLLQLCAAGNMIVANPSTPANLFHLLRRQVLARWRKPLFLVAPKSLFRAKAAVSRLSEMEAGTAFEPVIAEKAKRMVRRIVLCSGKIYYELLVARAEAGREDDVGLLRLEQLYPFPRAAVQAALARYPGASLVWCQEEPRNQGAWDFVRRELPATISMVYAGREAWPVAAAGSVERHEREQRALLARALG